LCYAGRKRAASDDGTSPRLAKTTKTSTGRAKGKTGPKVVLSLPGNPSGPSSSPLKTNLSAKTFKSQALPLHISITHTPPPVVEESGEKVPVESADPGFLVALSLQPSSFSTGTYGWKGSRRTTIEVDNPDTGEKEKLQVQLTFNATVLGSKGKDGDDGEAKEEEEKKEEKEKKEEEKKEEEKKEEKGEEKTEEKEDKEVQE